MTAEEMHDRADELRKAGDALGYKSAEGKRILRDCRRLRLRAWAIQAAEKKKSANP